MGLRPKPRKLRYAQDDHLCTTWYTFESPRCILSPDMPAPHTVPNCVQVTLNWTAGSTVMTNVLHARKTSPPAIDQAFANTIDSAIKGLMSGAGNVLTFQGTVISFRNVSVRDVSTANLAKFDGAGAALPGTGTGNVLPSTVALCVTHRTARAGKSFRGRSYFPGIIVSATDGSGHISTAAQTSIVAFYNSVRTTLNSNGLVLAVAHPDTYNTALPPVISIPGFTTDVTASVSRNLNLETQRRRVF